MTHDYKAVRNMVVQGMRLGRTSEDAVLSALDLAIRQKTYMVSIILNTDKTINLDPDTVKSFVKSDVAANLQRAALDAMVITEQAGSLVGTLTVILPDLSETPPSKDG